jgi:hypothetical protein
MPRQSKAVQDALQEKTISDVQASIVTLTKAVSDGFTGVHTRQDMTNGKVQKAGTDIIALQAKFEYNRIIWYLLTVSVSVIITLVSYIIFKHPVQ